MSVAQIGVGYWGPNLLRNLVASRRCKVKAVADLAAQRRDYVLGLYPGVAVTDNADDVLQDKDTVAVVIATPVATHFDLAVRALKAGKHILVEKPIATTVVEVDEIGRIAREKKLVAMAGHTFLYNAAVRYAKKLIDSGELGDIRYIYSQRLNLGRIRSDVDALWNFAPHDISIIQYWLGDPEPVSIVKRGVDYIQEKIDDVVFMNIVYPNKVMANIHVSWLDPRRLRQMTVVGSRKMIVYDNDAENKIAIFDKGIDRLAVLGQNMDYDDPRYRNFNHREGDVILPRIPFPEPIKVEIDHFIDCIENGTACLSGIDHARKVVRILAAR
ncbi:MAG TPA: Gfo/Idh/MocA family oxidoreductase [Syntrophales bacterium]|nr:Gfo/Idh/MocA family oxidoreductase [Syntrophales bacterium]HRT61701.1 Gfo/Idh/MocA family oxidoreductase [Syntrophales bacterium]